MVSKVSDIFDRNLQMSNTKYCKTFLMSVNSIPSLNVCRQHLLPTNYKLVLDVVI